MAVNSVAPILVRERIAQYIRSRDYINEYQCPDCENLMMSTKYHADKGKTRCKSCHPRECHKTSHDPRFMVWNGMKQRCKNPRSRSYPEYGGRGIRICPEWELFSGFMKWDRFDEYRKGLQIDRIDNDGDYSPDNCRWVTPSENARNTRSVKLTTDDVRVIRMLSWSGLSNSQVAEIFSVTASCISHIMTFRNWGDV